MQNLQQMLNQVKVMQEQLQKQLDELAVEATAGGGMVTVKMNGQKQLCEIRIDPRVITERDRDMLQALILAAVNEASRKVDEELANKMSSLANLLTPLGLKIPGLF